MADPIASLVADTPIVLLPVRVETRWSTDTAADPLELRIRVYPDEIHIAETPTVTAAERADAAAYHAAVAQAAPDPIRARNAQLVERYGASRAAWLIRALAPGAPPVADADKPTTTHVAAMPDHWIAIVKGPNFRAVAEGTRIQEKLAAAPVDKDERGSEDMPALGSELRWILDFETAKQAGMALSISVPRAEAERLDEIMVLGVAAGSPDDAAKDLGALVSKHATTSGAALLAPGTPTNTAATRDTARATGDRGAWSGSGSRGVFAIGDTPTGDAARTIAALGISADDARDVAADHADRDQIIRLMHHAMWPATWGFFLPELASQPADAVARARQLFLDHVRPAGPLPALRVRSQPYGLLPATSLAQWPAAAARGGLAGFLARVEQVLRPTTNSVPRLVGSDDVDRDLVAILRRLPVSRGAWVRQATDSATHAVSLGGDLASAFNHVRDVVERMNRSWVTLGLGLPTSMRLLDLVYADTAARLGIPLVAPPGTPPDQRLPHDYLAGIAAASASDLDTHHIDGAEPRTLLYLLARYATAHAHIPPPEAVETGGAAGTTGTMATMATMAVRDHRAGRVWTRLDEALGRASVLVSRSVREHKEALRALGNAPVGELEHALAGVIDSASYRVDAWSTAIASERLTALRTAKPRASYVGGWAWLEAPRPLPGQPGRGFLHAPSLAQARTAAVLRAGYEAHRTDDTGKTLALDISAERVRNARWLLDGMREGRPLSRLLGDHLERWLGKHAPAQIAKLRNGADMIDGWAQYHSWREHEPEPPLRDAYKDLETLLDSVADLLVAESVHAAVAGSPARAGAALDALERGEVATPDPRVDRTATDGKRVQRRVALLLGAAPGWPGNGRRAAAAPELEGFAARALGKPEHVAIELVVERNGATTTVQRTLADLKLCALDAVLLAADGEQAFLAAATASVTEGSVKRATGGPALDELVLRGAALARLLRAAYAPHAGDLGSMTVHEPRARETEDLGLASLAMPAPVEQATGEPASATIRAERSAWLADMARVRPALEPLDLLSLIAPELFRVRHESTKELELTIYATTASPTVALVVDGWSEAPPASEITTGAAFPYDAPRGQPPQAILLAVPPPTIAWSLPLLEAIVDETIARAKLRMIAPEAARGQLAPTILVTDDKDELVPAIDFAIEAFFIAEAVHR